MKKEEKIIERIRKVIELSKNNPSEEEAKAAALKAQKMMSEYHIHMEDIDITENKAIGEEPVNVSAGNKWKYALAEIISVNFRCMVFSYGSTCITFYGYAEDAKTAAMVFQMLFTIGNKEANKYYRIKRKEHPGLFNGSGIRNAYLNGYLKGIQKALFSQATALAVVVPQDVEDKFKEKTAGCSKCDTSFMVRTGTEGYSARKEGEIKGREAVMSKQIESV